MDEQQLVPPPNLDESEKKELLEFFSELDISVLRTFAESLSMLVRAFDGRNIDDDYISKLTDVKNVMERSRFENYPLLAKQVYLRLIARYNPQAQACKEWADYDAHALIGYKGLGRSEYVEMTKSTREHEENQNIYVGMKEERKQAEAKKHFWSRSKKEAEPGDIS